MKTKGAIKKPLGIYSEPYSVKEMLFRDFDANLTYDFHCAPRPQYIIYLEGEVEVETSGGDKKILKAGDILFANDTSGEGHITRTLKAGRAVIVAQEA